MTRVASASTHKSFYGSVEVPTVIGVTGTIRSGGSGQIISFDANTFWAAAESSIDKNKTMNYLMVVTNSSGSKASLTLYYTDSSRTTLMSSTYTGYSTYGITVDLTYAGTDYIDLTPIYSTSYQAKEIKKLYGMTGEISDVSGVVDTGTIFTGLDGSAFANNIMDLANPKLTSAPTKVQFSYDQTSDTCTLDVITPTGSSNIFNGQPTIILYIRGNKLGLTGLSTWVRSYIDGDPKTSVEDSITLTATFTGVTTSVRKFYGSVNGRTKLAYQSFGHVDYT